MSDASLNDKKTGVLCNIYRLGSAVYRKTFNTELEAAQAYDIYVRENGLSNPLNFIKKD